MNRVEIKFSRDEAVVLFEFLSRFVEEDELRIEDDAEDIALWNLKSDLEKFLIEPFQENYKQAVEDARKNLRNEE